MRDMRSRGQLSVTTISRGSVSPLRACSAPRFVAERSLTSKGKRRPRRGVGEVSTTGDTDADDETRKGSRGGLRYNRRQGGRLLDPSCELEVLKCIMLREGYLSRVTRLAEDISRKAKRGRGQMHTLPAGMIDLLDLLRTATLDSVEAISLWRLSQADPTPSPFEWNGHNYLLKILHDCDFLDRVEALRRWLGFRVSRNPFFLPDGLPGGLPNGRSSNLSDCSDNPEEGCDARSTTAPLRFDKTGAVDVGRQPWLGPLKIATTAEEVPAIRGGGGRNLKRLKGSGGIENLAPYAAAVLNDPSLIPKTAPSSSSAATNKRNAARSASIASVNIEGIVPNLVSKEDVQRAIAARKALDEEEQRVAGIVGEEKGEERRPQTRPCERPRKNSRKFLGSSISASAASIETGLGEKQCPQYNPRDHRSTRRVKSAAGVVSAIDDTIDTPSRAAAHNTTAKIMRSLALTAAELMQRPHPKPHPGLGPVLLRSDEPGGELHGRPFVHTVTAFTAISKHDELGPALEMEGPIISTQENRGCLTASSISPGWEDTSVRGGTCPTQQSPRHVSDADRVATAPATTSGESTLLRTRGAPAETRGDNVAQALCQQSFIAPRGEERLGVITDAFKDASRASSRKAGAELRALTAAGTTGRRQPPPREVRLRRLARDVARHTAELRELRRAEERIRRTLVRCFRGKHGGERLWSSETGHQGGEDEIDSVVEVGAIRGNFGWSSPMEAETENAAWRNGASGRCASAGVDVVEKNLEREHAGISRSPHKNDILGPRTSGTHAENGLLKPDDEIPQDIDPTRTLMVAAERMKRLLEAKLREIELKTLDLAVKRDELGCLRVVQKQERERKRAVEMERRRARLPEGKILPEDEAVARTLEDQSALRIQKRHRGIRGRQYAVWYKNNIRQAATTIQRGVRYVWDRRATARRLLLGASARPIQAMARMFFARQRYVHFMAEGREVLACCKLQRAGRGMLGRSRAAARRSMIAAAGKALEWVSLDTLQPKHLKELENAIRGALIDPLRQFPPSGVLGALRVVLTVLDDPGTENNAEAIPQAASSEQGDMVTFQTALGKTVRGPVSPPHLTWEMAARVLGRPFRLLRRLRAFASGLGAASDPTPARTLRLPSRALELLEAYRNDSSWAREALLSLTEGGTAAASLVGWAKGLLVVHREQPRVQAFLRDAQPAWLRKNRSFQKRRRALELHAESCRHSVAVAMDHRQDLETRGLAYGDALLALEALEERLVGAQTALEELEAKRTAFIAGQTKAQAAEGQALREYAEFAEREASVAARAESMARRIGQGGPEGLAELGRKRLDCEVVLRELKRQLHVWERRCREEYTPLLEEWVPPTEKQTSMACSLGSARAMEEILTVRKARLVERAGGTRFIKGLKGEDFQNWRRACEGLRDSREGVESGEARLTEDVLQFEDGVRAADVAVAAHKVSSTSWDNATDETIALERTEDIEAAQEERWTAMGATLPPGLLDSTPAPPPKNGQGSSGLSRRPTLVLLGLDLPASVRAGIRTRLDRDAPGIFGLHLTGEDALPSRVGAARACGRGFFAPSRELAENVPIGPHHGAVAAVERAHAVERAQAAYISRKGEDMGVDACLSGHKIREPSRATKVQTALSSGRSVSLEVIPGPGLWARGRFLRDLESLLEGIDGCNSYEDAEVGQKALREGPTVILLEGHHRNRSGGGSELGHGTRFATALGPTQIDSPMGRTPGRTSERETGGPSAVAAMATRRLKCLMEKAAQCLHDLRTTHGATPSPFMAIHTETRAAVASTPVPEAHLACKPVGENAHIERGPLRSEGSVSTGGALKAATDVDFTPRLDALLAACLMLLYPHRQYDLGEREAGNHRSKQSKTPQSEHEEAAGPGNAGDETGLSHLSELAKECREHFSSSRSARVVADLLEVVDLAALPIGTAVALSRIIQSQAWHVASPRVDFAGCPASAAFVGWIVAAVTAAVELALGGGGAEEAPAKLSANGPHLNIGVCETTVLSGATPVSKPGGLRDMASRRSTVGAGGGIAVPEGTQDARWRERGLLERLEAHVVDESITVMDNDMPRLMQTEAVGGGVGRGTQGRRCRVSEVFTTIMDTVLRPYQVFEEADCSLTVEGSEQPDRSGGVSTFRVTVSRAFGSIYVRAVPLNAGAGDRRHAAMARAKDDKLLHLLSPNWMEQHDLATLRELRTEPAVWRSLIDTIVIDYQPNVKQPHMGASQPGSSLARSLPLNSDDTLIQESEITKDASEPQYIHGTSARSATPSTGAVVLSFRHARRLTLETSCLLMGCAVPVKVYEESRSDFWCEASIPPELARVGKCSDIGNTMVGTRIPKECIPLLLNNDNPMRMQTALDAADMRELSVLIADRLKLCRVESARQGPRSYHHWLNNAIGCRNETSNPSDTDKQTGQDGNVRDGTAGGGEFRLSLRKRGVGQVVFSRLVSFWVPAVDGGRVEGAFDGSSCDVGRVGSGEEREGEVGASEACALHVRRLVTVKEVAHRGACGELRVEVHNLTSSGGTQPVTLTPELTNTLLEQKRVESARNSSGEPFSSPRYWCDALTWRLRLCLEPLVRLRGVDGDDDSYFVGETRESDSTKTLWKRQGRSRISVDEREPIFSIRSVPAGRGVSAITGLESPTVKSPTPGDMFDLLLLSVEPRQNASRGRSKQKNDNASIELVATHRQTMDIFTFLIPVTAIFNEFSSIVDACLAAPTALSADLQLPASGALREIAGTWLSFSPTDDGGYGGAVTLNFPGVASMSTCPRVGLRAGFRSSSETGCAAMANKPPLLQSRVGRALDSHTHAKDGSDDGAKETASSSGELSSRSQNTRGSSIALLPIDTRNERMVFRRELMVPLLQDPNDILPGTYLLERKDGKPEARALMISVYEAFPAEADGRVGRYLKICARDESIRPALETTVSVPWVGTCEAVEGSRVWRLATEGLRLWRIRNEMKYVRIELNVSVPEANSEHRSNDLAMDGSEDRSDDLATRAENVGVLEQQNAESRHVVSASSVSCGETLTGNIGEARAGDWSVFNDPHPIDLTQHQEREPQDSCLAEHEAASLVDDASTVSSEAAVASLVQSQRKSADPIRRQSSGSSTTALPMALVDPNATDDAVVRSEASSTRESKHCQVKQGDAQDEEQRNHGEKVYDGWHCITGMRLHVQCFQDERCTAKHNLDNAVPDNNDRGVDGDEPACRRIAGRGGATSFPRPCYLQFVVCDPFGGQRSVARVSVDDARRNLSEDGGIVATGLLDAGRRPALAKAIAQKLRLVFQADGTYRVILPLPPGWKRAA